MKPKLKTCDGCKKPRPIWKSRGGKKLCKFCAGVDIIPKPTVKKKPISPRSSKQKKLESKYSILRKEFLSEHPMCETHLGSCMRQATDVHHKRGRGKYLLDKSTYLAVCRFCHEFIETHPDIARSMGWSESRLTNTKNMGELSKGGLVIKEINLEELVEDVKDMGAEMLTGFIDGEEAVSSFSKPIAPSSSGVNLIVRDFHNLYYNEGSSDKVYNIQLAEVSGSDPLLAVVNFAYGRRGTTYTTGTKTPKPIAADKARTIYNKLLKEKLGKGYNIDLKSDGSGVSSGGPSTKESVGFLPQLLNDCSEEDVERLINDHSYCMQEKYDGENRMIIQYNKGQDAFGGNKKGEKTTLTDQVIDAAKYAALGWRFVLNGEDMGSHIMIFDYIPSDDNMSNKSYIDRYKMLSDNFNFDDRVLRLAPTAWSTEEKRAMFEDVKSRNGEGVVFKKILALHAQGRPSSGGPQLKFKFYATASVIVSGINEGKRSVEVSVINYDGGILPVGNVTVYPNQEIPEVNSVIEVRYLYWYPGGSLYQPVFLKVRNDVDMAECFIGQLKAKAETPE